MLRDVYDFLLNGGAKVMGILNVTPDSFYDGGHYIDPDLAIEKAWKMREEGASIIDVGAESTRPGSEGVTDAEEISRLAPVLEGLKGIGIPVSLDTSKPRVASLFLARGLAHIINDVHGFSNPDLVEIVKEFDVPVIMMHMFGTPKTMQQVYVYGDVVNDIKQFFRDRLAKTGLEKVVVDPGIGFGKSVEHNLEIIERLDEFCSLKAPVMLGISRKSFIGKVLNAEASDRLEGSLAALAISVERGARIVRVHDVNESVRVVKMVEAIKNVSYKEIQI